MADGDLMSQDKNLHGSNGPDLLLTLITRGIMGLFLSPFCSFWSELTLPYVCGSVTSSPPENTVNHVGNMAPIRSISAAVSFQICNLQEIKEPLSCRSRARVPTRGTSAE